MILLTAQNHLQILLGLCFFLSIQCGGVELLTELLQSRQTVVPLGKLTSSGVASPLLPGLFLTQQQFQHNGSKSLLIHTSCVFWERANFWGCNAGVERRVQTGKTEATLTKNELIFHWRDFWGRFVCSLGVCPRLKQHVQTQVSKYKNTQKNY